MKKTLYGEIFVPKRSASFYEGHCKCYRTETNKTVTITETNITVTKHSAYREVSSPIVNSLCTDYSSGYTVDYITTKM